MRSNREHLGCRLGLVVRARHGCRWMRFVRGYEPLLCMCMDVCCLNEMKRMKKGMKKDCRTEMMYKMNQERDKTRKVV